MITILLTVSRIDYLEKVITSLELLECNHENTNILAIVDGNDELYLRTRNLINDTKYLERLTVRAKLDSQFSRLDVPTRRKRIAEIHNQAKTYISHNDGFIFSVEDDTTFPPETLQRLLKQATQAVSIGFVEGVELGRWGVRYVGAWTVNDIYLPTQFVSVEKEPLEVMPTKIDAGGLYCALIRTELYKAHIFNADNGLGPDINFGIDIRQKGYEAYINWSVRCTHHYQDGKEHKTVTADDDAQIVTITKLKNKWHVTY